MSTLQPSHLHGPSLLPEPTRARTREKEPWVELGWPGIDPLRSSLDIIDFDHSGSVIAAGGTDPIGNRFREAGQAIKIVQAWTMTKRPKVAVIHFDQPSLGNSGPVSLSSPGALLRLSSSLRVPPASFGTSDLAPSLAEAERLAAAHPDHDVRFTILSDFELTDDDPSAVFERLAAFPGQVHAVVLNAQPPADLAGENITITRLQHGDPPGALAAAIHRSLTATRRGRRLSMIHADRTQPSIPPLSPASGSKGRAR